MTHEIYDTRKPTRTDGPYADEVVAQQAADQVNDYIYRNSSIGQALPDAKVKGPYLVRPVTPRSPSGRGVTVVYDGANDPDLDSPRVL